MLVFALYLFRSVPDSLLIYKIFSKEFYYYHDYSITTLLNFDICRWPIFTKGFIGSKANIFRR